jgi:gamma-glutamylcysteine synthetase
MLTYDCSYNNLEFSFGKESDLNIIADRFTHYYSFVLETLMEYGYTVTGMGVNPYRKYNKSVPIPNGRYRMLYHHLSSYQKYRLPMFFHPWPNYGMFSSASQVQLDVYHDDLIPTIRAFSLLEPVKAVLFANSVLTDEWEDLLCCRDMLWENSTHGVNPHNIGMFDELPCTIDELLEYIASTSIYCTEQDGKYINFEPMNIVDYFRRKQIYGEYYDVQSGLYRDIVFAPKREDLKHLRSFKFEDLTFRGTIEFRSVCCQPVRDAMSVAAFHLGLIGQSARLNEILAGDCALYGHGYNASELRKLLNWRQWPEFIDRAALKSLLAEILTLAHSELAQRGLGEEKYLAPLFARAENLSNPARDFLARTDSGERVESIIADYGAL